MANLERYSSPAKVQRIGNDSVYGTGSDANVVIASNTSLSRDMYYNNLTINAGTMLNTNGFKVFVKETLTLNGNIGVGQADTANTGTVSGQASVLTSTTISLGGNAFGNTYTASTMSTALLRDVSTAILGYYIDTDSNTKVVTGGAGGGHGVAGTVTPGAAGTVTPGAAGTVTPGAAGTVTPAAAGSGAGAGGGATLNRNTLSPGGAGTAGGNGAAGSTPAAAAAGTITAAAAGTISAASAGSTPPAASAGVGSKGGPLVIVVAKTFAGTGYILAQGKNAVAGGASATGTGAGPSATSTNAGGAATSTNAGGAATGTGATNGHAGTAAPGQAIAHHSDNTSSYITGDGSHGHHQAYPAPALPHGSHVPHTSQGVHHDRYVYHAVYVDSPCGDGTHGHGAGHFHNSPYGHYHGYSPHDAAENTANFHNQNGIGHNHGHRNQPGVAYSGNTHQQHVDSSPEHHNWHSGSMQCADWKGHHYTTPRHHGARVGYGHTNAHRNAGTVSHVGHLHAAGGAAGAAGTNGTNGSTTAGTNAHTTAGTNAHTTAGTNGSTTAGTAGQSGGGGGIIIVTETTPVGIQTSVSGGVVGSNTASSGTVVTVLNA